MTSVLSAIGLPVCLSRAPRPTGPPASRPASKGHSSVKRLRKMSVKGSSGSHTLSGPAQLPPILAAWNLLCPPWPLYFCTSSPCLICSRSGYRHFSDSVLLGDGLVRVTGNRGVDLAADFDTAVSSGSLTDLEPWSCCHLLSVGVVGIHHAQFM